MVTNTGLKADPREQFGKGPVGRLRRSGRVPAIVYGHGDATRAISVDALELERLFAHISVENTLIELDVQGESAVRALIRDIQMHPFKAEVLHVDFYQVHAGEAISLEIPIRLVGTSAGVREGGVLQQVLHELSIRCEPDKIPEQIEVDISSLEIGDSVHVSTLDLPEGVEVETDLERTVCSVVAPTVAAVEEEVEEVEAAEQPELIRRRAEEEGEED